MPLRLLPSLPLLVVILHCCWCCGAAVDPAPSPLTNCPTDQSYLTAPLPQSVGAAVLLTSPGVRLELVSFLNNDLLRVENGSLVLNRSLDAAESTGPYSGPYTIMCSDPNQSLGTFSIYLQLGKQPAAATSIPATTTTTTTTTPTATTTTTTTTTIASINQVVKKAPASTPTPTPSIKASTTRSSLGASVAQPPAALDPRVLPLTVVVGLLLVLSIALSVALVLMARRVCAGSGRAGAAPESAKSCDHMLLPIDGRSVA